MSITVTDGQLGQLAVKQNELFERAKRNVYADFGEMLRALQVVIEGKTPEPPTLALFYTLQHGDGRTAVELLAAGNYGKVWDYARMFVESKDFPISSVAEEADFELVEFEHDPSTDEVLAEFKRCGLERPLAEDALRFGEKYPDLQLERSIVFLHEPWRAPDGNRNVLYLAYWNGNRSLGTGIVENDWRRACRFPGRRPRK